MSSDPEISAWIAGLTAEQIMTGISAAIKDRDWLAVEGLMKLLAIKDPESAQIVYDTMIAVASRNREN